MGFLYITIQCFKKNCIFRLTRPFLCSRISMSVITSALNRYCKNGKESINKRILSHFFNYFLKISFL